jgi:hypothetical protein
MASSSRRFTFAAVVLPLFLLVISGRARADLIYVNTLGGDTDAAACTLPDAIETANNGSAAGGCALIPASGADVILIGLTGTIFVAAGRLPLTINDEALEITTFGDGPVVIDGSAKDGVDGGIMFVSSLNKFLKLTTLTFANGVAEFGGALYSETGGDVDIKECLFENNTANYSLGGLGGAIVEDTGRMEITNSTFFGNDALKYSNTAGGAIFVDSTATSLKLTNDTFEHNYAKEGSAIFNNTSSAANVQVKGNIFADNLDHAGTGVTSPKGNCAGNSSPPVTDNNYNLSVDNSCGFTAGSSLSNETAADLDLDPLGLQNNGGPSFTVALGIDSDALARIPVANCTEQDSHMTPLGVDQRLFGRPDPVNPNACDSGAFELFAVGPYTLNSHRVQIARNPNKANSDMVNIGITFTANGDPDCDLGVLGDEDALNYGIDIGLLQGTCASLPFNGLFVDLYPFVVHTVNKEQYGTLYQTIGPETISARMVSLFSSPPPAGVCGAWTLNLEVGGLNTHGSINLPGGNPFALLIFDPTGDGESCFDINNAIVGNQIPPPPHGVRRGVRR